MPSVYSMSDPTVISDVASAIQLSVAPVFLLAGVGGLLNVLTSRLARAVDRVRLLSAGSNENRLKSEVIEFKIQMKRTNLIHWSIILSTVCALEICLVVVMLFEGNVLLDDPSTLITVLFISAMVSLTVAMILFLLEISLALRIMRSFSPIAE